MDRHNRPQDTINVATARPASGGAAVFRLTLFVAAMTTISLCSCRSGARTASIDPFSPESQVAETAAGEASNAGTARVAAAPIAAPAKNAVQQVAHIAEEREPIEHGVYTVDAEAPSSPVMHAEFTPAEPREPIALANHTGVGIGPAAGWIQPTSPVHAFPDEYLCDGGDRGYPVHYDAYNRLGFETEDTIAEYRDHTGVFHMKPTNKVCVYAPRFGALRTISAPEEGLAVDRLASAEDTRYGAGLNARAGHVHHAQREGSERMRVRSRASGFEREEFQAGVALALPASSHTKLLNAYEDLQFLRTGQFLRTEEARLAAAIQAAVVWTRAENPVIVASEVGGNEVRSRFSAAVLKGVEDQRVKGRLQIIKLADKPVAEPGDILTFTIRYDNVGDHELREVRIADNLTPRLVYVEDSATSDRAGIINVADNNEGSVVLTIELDEPLPGRTGGVITFQARVR